MPRQTGHPLRTLLGALGWAGSSDEMSTPFGDTLQATVGVGLFDPPWETFGVRLNVAAPLVNNARIRLFYATGQQVSAFRVRAVTSTDAAFAGLVVRTIQLAETADPIVTPQHIFSSLGAAWPFTARSDEVVGTGSRGWAVPNDQQILPTEGLFVRAPNVLEIVCSTPATALDFNILVDVMRSQGPVG